MLPAPFFYETNGMDERNRHVIQLAEAVFCGLLLLAAVAALPSCRTVRTSAQKDSIRIEVRHDTLVWKLRDSVYITEKAKNDTVYITKYAERWHERERIVERTDTLYVDNVKTETVTVSKTNKFTLASTVILWTLVAAAVGYGIFRIIRKFRIP